MPETRTRQVYRDGALVETTSYEVSDAELRHEAAEARLRAGRAALRQTRSDAAQFANGSAALTVAQLTAASRQLAGGIARLAQTLLDLELMVAAAQDDGAE